MKMKVRAWWFGPLVLLVGALACVTINIYFPVEKVESVAKDIVSDVTGKETPVKPAGDESGLWQEIWNASCVWAEEATAVSNPTIRAVKDSLKELYAQLLPYFKKGLITEGDDGYVAMGEAPGLGLKEKRDLKNLVEATNQNRANLYQEVAKAMKIDPSQVNKVAEVFAKEWKKSLE